MSQFSYIIFFVCLFAPMNALANWERVNIRTIQETTLNQTHTATFMRDSLNAVNGSALSASAPLIQQGHWNSAGQFSPTTPGGAFSLMLHSHPADPEPPNSYDALSSPSSGRSITTASNQLEGRLTERGELQAVPGSRASSVTLTATQTLSVF